MSYRNKTYVAFASEDITMYRMMEAWRENEHIDFNFYDAHDLFVSKDSSKPETIKHNLRERMKNAKQVVLLGSADAKRKGADKTSFFGYEIELIREFNLPVVISNLDGNRNVEESVIPKPLLDASHFTVSVSFQPAIIRFALNNYPIEFSRGDKFGPHQYGSDTYTKLGL